MSPGPPWRRWLSGRLLAFATRRLARRHPDWAAGLAAEDTAVDEADRLRWSVGCVVASCRAPGAIDPYPAALAGGLVALAAYQWSADEGVLTLVVIGAVGLALGLLSPSRFLLSGVAVGLTVAAVNAVEALTGLHPAYETHHSLTHALRWTVLAAPALAATTAGRFAALRLKS